MQKTKIGIVGLHQSGKSLLINCILKRVISKVGTGSATTHTPVYYDYSDDEYAEYFDNSGCHQITPEDVVNYDGKESVDKIHVHVDNTLLKAYTLIDLPGTGFNMSDNTTTAQVLKELDYAILLATDVKEYTSSSSFYSNTLELLKKNNIPYFFVFNCTKIERWSPNNKANIDIANSDLELLQKFEPLTLLEEHEYPLVNLIWYWCSLVDCQDELYKLYYEDIRNYFERKGKELNKLLLEEASNFNVVSRIFNKDNRKLLELRRDFRNELKRAKEEMCPVGTIQAFGFEHIPQGWLPCNGELLEIAIYPELFNAIGNIFGGNPRKGKFALPDLRSRFVRGNDEKNRVGTIQEDSIQGHNHIVSSCSENGRHYHYVGYHDYATYEANTFYTTYQHKHVCTYGDSAKTGNFNTDHDGSHKHEITIGLPCSNSEYGEIRMSEETRPKNVTMQFCIKAQ